MDTTAAKLTVFFEEPFWVGVYERTESGQVEACRVVFGAEPKDYEVYDFLLKHWDSMRFSPPVAAEGIPSQIRNPKRARRKAGALPHRNGNQIATGPANAAGTGQTRAQKSPQTAIRRGKSAAVCPAPTAQKGKAQGQVNILLRILFRRILKASVLKGVLIDESRDSISHPAGGSGDP